MGNRLIVVEIIIIIIIIFRAVFSLNFECINGGFN